MRQNKMQIGELARRTGLTTSRIRYDEEVGLLRVVGRRANGYRVYPQEAETILNLIVMGQRAGFTLEEMQVLVPGEGREWDHQLIATTLDRKIAEIEAQQMQLAASKAQLLLLKDAIACRPADLDCTANTARIVALALPNRTVKPDAHPGPSGCLGIGDFAP